MASRVAAIFALVGGALGVAGFFLPWYSTSVGSAQNGPPTVVTYSAWNFMNYFLTGANLPGATSSGQNPGAEPYLALTLALPAIMALVALVVGGIGLLRGLGTVLGGLLVAAGITSVLGGGSSLSSFILLFAIAAARGPASSTNGMGTFAMQLGFFAILAGGIMAIAQARRGSA
jgi:hypothetical protein